MADKELFLPGRILATPGAIGALEASGQTLFEFLDRHIHGDWGELSEHDVKENQLSLEHGFRLLSCYPLKNGQKLWIITEHDRSSTTALLPDEY